MCLLITAAAAGLTTGAWYLTRKQDLQLSWLALAYWSAVLMWTVDGFFCLAAGEAFFDLSASDGLLGLVVVGCGAGCWLVYLLLHRIRGKRCEARRAC